MSSGSDNQHEISASTKPTGVRFPSRNYSDDWTRTLDAFDILATLGEGTFGWVQKARDRQNGEIVALKKIKMENETEGFPITAIREIKILKQLRDRLKTQNVVLLKEVVAAPERDMNSDDKGSIYLVFEYMEHDLAGLMDLRWDTIFRMETIKCFMKQMLDGLHSLHHNRIIHRDIKASNLLVNGEGVLKIADFGLARPQVDEPYHYTANVITLWYRPPELLLAQNKKPSVVYSTYVDMWSAGCILAEMIFRAPLFKGKTELELLDGIFRVLGTPTKETHPNLWPAQEWTEIPANRLNPPGPPDAPPKKQPIASPYDVWRTFKPAQVYPPRLQQMCLERKVPAKTYEFLSALLTYDPMARLKALDALDHDWFWEDPLPCKPSEVGSSCPPSNELLARKHKEEEKQRQQAYMQQHKGAKPPHPAGHPQGHQQGHMQGHHQGHSQGHHPNQGHQQHHHPTGHGHGHGQGQAGHRYQPPAANRGHSHAPHRPTGPVPGTSTSMTHPSTRPLAPQAKSATQAYPLGGAPPKAATYGAYPPTHSAYPTVGAGKVDLAAPKPPPPATKPPPPSSTPPPAPLSHPGLSNGHSVPPPAPTGAYTPYAHYAHSSSLPNAPRRPPHPAPSSLSQAPSYQPKEGYKHSIENPNKRFQTQAPMPGSNDPPSSNGTSH
jgi:cyclin-dependent kinase 12/13